MHLKRQEVPKSWPVYRKGTKYVVKPGSALETGVPLLLVLRDMLHIAQNRKEAKRAISYIASKGNHISFINIGSGYSGSFSDHVREVGGDVHNVSDSSDLPKLILGKAKEIYAIQ